MELDLHMFYITVLHWFFICNDVTFFKPNPYYSDNLSASDLTSDFPLLLSMVSPSPTSSSPVSNNIVEPLPFPHCAQVDSHNLSTSPSDHLSPNPSH